MIFVSPSILASDFSNLGQECEKLTAAGADFIHFDVMDGHFVDNISVGAPVLESLAKRVPAVYDVHLMVTDPYDYIDMFCDAGAGILTFHAESDSNVIKTIKRIKRNRVKPGLSVKPGTPVELLYEYLDAIELALVMTVEPGFGGQKFIPDMCAKISSLKTELEKRGRNEFLIEVDGGINKETACMAAAAGANVLVAGSYIFKEKDYAAMIKELKAADITRLSH